LLDQCTLYAEHTGFHMPISISGLQVPNNHIQRLDDTHWNTSLIKIERWNLLVWTTADGFGTLCLVDTTCPSGAARSGGCLRWNGWCFSVKNYPS